MGSGERRKRPQRGRGMDFIYILGQKEAIWNTIFSIFERRGAPKLRWARENSPFPPLHGPSFHIKILTLDF